MSTRDIGVDRRGPKDLNDLARKAQAYKRLINAKEANDAGKPGAQLKLDDAFQHFAELHANPETGTPDTAEMQATMAMLNAHLKKGL